MEPFLPMGKLDAEKLIQWWDQIKVKVAKELSQEHSVRL